MSIGQGQINIAVNIQNQEKIFQLTDALKNQEDAIRRLDAAYRDGKITQQQFFQAAAPYAQNIRQLSQELQSLQGVEKSGKNAAMGLMMMSQAIDDAQYGFKAIVNNIPGMTLALGQAFGMGTEGALKLGGALGIAAVAINTWVQHWEDAKVVFGDTAAFQAAENAIEKVTNRVMEMIASVSSGLPTWQFMGEDIRRQMDIEAHGKKQDEKEQKRIDKAREHVEGLRTKGQQERGREFEESLAEYEGEDKGRLRREMTERSLKNIADPKQRAKMRRAIEDVENEVSPQGPEERKLQDQAKKRLKNIDTFIADAMEGRATGTDIARGAPGVDALTKKRQAERQQKILDEMGEHDRKEAERRMKADARDEKKEEKRNEDYDHRQKMRNLEDSRMLFQEDMDREQKSKSKPFKGSYFEYATSHGESFGEKRRNEKLDAIKGAVKDVEKAIKEERRRHEDVMARLAD